MMYKSYYNSPIGEILLVASDDALLGLWFISQKYYLGNIKGDLILCDNLVLVQAKKWLDRYFIGDKPSINELNLKPCGSEFRKMVWKILCEIPYGEVITYGDIARLVALKMNRKSMSAQAIGGAVGHNPISIIIPCHRVIGSDGSLTGYAGGIDKKMWLLNHEKVEMDRF